LEDLNLLETTSRLDFAFAGGILAIILFLSLLLILYMHNFCKKVYYNRTDFDFAVGCHSYDTFYCKMGS